MDRDESVVAVPSASGTSRPLSNVPVIGHARPSKSRKAILVLVIAISATALRVHAEDSPKPAPSRNELPAEVARVFHSTDKAILYSLEPWDNAARTESTLHGFKIIGQMDLDRGLAKTVAARFKEAIASRKDRNRPTASGRELPDANIC